MQEMVLEGAFTVGQAARICLYYDPGKPAQAVLEQASHSNWVQIAIGIVLIAAGFVLAIR